jgi:hypothetical protein
MYALEYGANTSFSKHIFWKHIRMRLVLEYNWHETAVFTIQKTHNTYMRKQFEV